MEEKTESNQKKWYYLGFTAKQLDSVWPHLRKDNLLTLRNLSLFCTFLFIAASTFPLIIKKFYSEFFLYLCYGAGSFIFYLITRMCIKKKQYEYNTFKARLFDSFLIYLFDTLVATFGMYIGICHNMSHPATQYFLIILSTEFLFSFRLLSNFIPLAIGLFIFGLCSYYFKPNAINVFDIASCITTFIFSTFVWAQIMYNRIKQKLEEIRLVQTNAMLYDISTTDILTKLYNRQKFTEVSQQMLIARDLQKNTLAVAFIDIDDFRNYNEMYGHDKGDTALTLISQEFIKSAKQHDIAICRWGGEEFMAMFEVQTSEQAEQIAEELRASVEALQLLNQTIHGQKYLSISIGLHVLSGRHSETWEEIYHNTYELLSLAKEHGRNCVEFSIN